MSAEPVAMPVEVLIAAPRHLLRSGLRLVLEAEPTIRVVAEVAGGEETVLRTAALAPHVVVLAPGPVDRATAAAVQRIRAGPAGRASRVLLVEDGHGDVDALLDVLRAGARGVANVDDPPERLVEAVLLVAAGLAVAPPALVSRLVDRLQRDALVPPLDTPALPALTPREQEVLELIAGGRSNAEIAAALVLQPSTVKSHVSHLLKKLQLNDRSQAIVLAFRSGLARAGPEALPAGEPAAGTPPRGLARRTGKFPTQPDDGAEMPR